MSSSGLLGIVYIGYTCIKGFVVVVVFIFKKWPV